MEARNETIQILSQFLQKKIISELLSSLNLSSRDVFGSSLPTIQEPKYSQGHVQIFYYNPLLVRQKRQEKNFGKPKRKGGKEYPVHPLLL